MDVSSAAFTTFFLINIACCVYIGKQMVKGVIWIMKMMLGDELLGEKRRCTCRAKEYRCRRCGLEFNHHDITAEDEKERDLCPACCKPLDEGDLLD